MFEKIIARAGRLARERADARSDALAARLAGELPKGIAVERTERGVRLSGRGIARRFALDPRLRWLAAERVR